MRLDGSQRRVLAVGGALILAIIVLGRGLPALRAWEQEQLARRDAALLSKAQIERIAALDPGARTREHLAARIATESHLIRGHRPTDAATMLTARLEESAAAAGVSVNASSTTADSVFTSRRARVAAHVIATAGVRQLAAWLSEIESSLTPMRVRELSITQAAPGASNNEPEALRIELTVESIVLQSDGAPEDE